MKNLWIICFLIFTMTAGSGFLKIGQAAPEFGKGIWTKGKKFSVAGARGKQMVAILFWQPDHSNILAMQNFIRYAYRMKGGSTGFAAVAVGSLPNVAKFPLNRQLGEIPLLIDVDKTNFKLFLRAENRLPMAVLIGKDGKLLWRGNPGRLPYMINAVEKKTYDQKKVIADDDFNAVFTGMIVKSNYKGALALLEKELDRPGSNPREIVALQVGIHYRRLNSAENAVAALHRAQKRFPLDPGFYEMELKMLELGHLEKRKGEFYFRLTNVFRNRPSVLLKFVTAELNRPFAQMDPASIYTVARAAANAGKYSGKREKGRALLYYAQSLYCLGRVDLALKAAEESLKFLKGAKEYKQAAEITGFYRKLVDFSPKITK
ncbi:MAG: hypothetical protein IJV93_13590 [Lentisphaeria bacterium]|nr:hypothetical protein [Lentisphaeria bacterium]